MIIKILGALDIFIAACFWLFGVFGIVPGNFILILGFFLLVKGVVFITGLSFPSFVDIIMGIVMITATSYHLSNIIIVLFSLFLLQKGIFSMFS